LIDKAIASLTGESLTRKLDKATKKFNNDFVESFPKVAKSGDGIFSCFLLQGTL
jgi:hypothetical protein